MSNFIGGNPPEVSEPKDFGEMKKTKKKKVISEEHKEKNRQNLAKAREKMAKLKEEKQKLNETQRQEEEHIKKSVQEHQLLAKKLKEDEEDEETEIDLDTLLDKKYKKKQQKAEKIKMLENITISNQQLLEKLSKMEDRVEKLYTLKKNKRRSDSPKQPIIIQQPAPVPVPYRSNNERMKELLSRTNY